VAPSALLEKPVLLPSIRSVSLLDIGRFEWRPLDLWDNSNTNVWFISLASWFRPQDTGKI
jgi:hypothetical protein